MHLADLAQRAREHLAREGLNVVRLSRTFRDQEGWHLVFEVRRGEADEAWEVVVSPRGEILRAGPLPGG